MTTKRVFIGTADLLQDADGNELIVRDAAIRTTKQAHLGVKTTANAWDNGDEYDLTAGGTIVPEYVHVFVKTNHAYLLADVSADDPTDTPSAYPAENTAVISAAEMTKLHFKSESAGLAATLTVTVFGN